MNELNDRPTTVIGFLETINDAEIRTLAIRYAQLHGVANIQVFTVHDAVSAFRWYETEEGSHFWRTVCNDLSLGN